MKTNDMERAAPDLRTVSTAALAYLGDAVLEIAVRRRLLECGYASSKSLNAHARDFVSAPAQSRAVERLLPHLTEEERDLFRRGRNIGHTNTPKHATVTEYRLATGLETLFGALYLEKKEDRIAALFALAYPAENTKGED